MANNETLENILEKLDRKIGYHFAYNSCRYAPSDRRTLKIENATLLVILRELFNDSLASFAIIGDQIVVGQKHCNIDNVVVNYNISGVIYDKLNHSPLPFVSIAVLGKTQGTTSNADGRFAFQFSEQELNDTIQFSFIGYRPQQKPIISCIGQPQEIRLRPSVISLQEVIIRSANPTQLVEAAISRERDNYSVEPFMQKCYYREIIKRDEKILNFSEAILEIYKSGYHTYGKDQIHLLKGRHAIIEKTDTVSIKLKAGLQSVLDLDLIKNKISFLQKNCLMNYTFILNDMVVDRNRLYYQIMFKPTTITTDYIPYAGELLIDSENMAIRRICFNIPKEELSKAASYFVYKSSSRLKLKVQAANYEINYQLLNNRYYFQSVKLNTNFKIRIKPNWQGRSYQLSTEAYVVNTDTVNVAPIARKQLHKTGMILTEQKELFANSYWDGYNFITPEAGFEKVIHNSAKSGLLYPF